MNHFGKSTRLKLIVALVYCVTAAVVARAEEPQSDSPLQPRDPRTTSERRPAETSTNEIDAAKYWIGEPPRGTTNHDVPDGPAVIRHTSGQRRAFMWPLELPRGLEDEETMAHFYMNLCYLSHADYKLTGQVVVEDAQPMRNVQMTVTAKELADIWNGTRRTDVFRQRLADGRFNIDLKGYLEVEVSFEKDGFRRELFEPHLAEPDTNDMNLDRMMQPEPPKIRRFTQDQLRIVLAKPKT